MRFLPMALLGAILLNMPLLADKQEDLDVSKIQRMTRWVKSWHLPTKEDVRKVLKFLSHEEYVKCLKDRKKCSWKKVAALVALDAAIVYALVLLGLIFPDAIIAARNRAERQEEARLEALSFEQFKVEQEKQEEKKQKMLKLPLAQVPEIFEKTVLDRRKIRDTYGVQTVRYGAQIPTTTYEGRGYYLAGFHHPQHFFEAIFQISLEGLKFFRTNAFIPYKKTLTHQGYSAIGVAAASYVLDENEKREVINYLIDEVGVVPTEKDRQMVKLFEWEQDEPARRKITIFGLPRWEKGRKQERLPTEPWMPAERLPREIIKKIGTYLMPPPLLPPEEPTGLPGMQEED